MKNLIGKSTLRTSDRSRLDRLRQLKMEHLEGRRLMAADFSPYHNDLIAEDVNRDFRVTPSDALAVINMLNSRAAGESPSTDSSLKWDVSGDGYLSPIDALKIINRLNGEGEGDNILMRFSTTITTTSGAPVSQVAVGSEFLVNVFVQDARDMSTRPINDDGEIVAGVFTAAVDLGVNNLLLADYLFPTNFRSGIQYATVNFGAQREGYQGGGIQLGLSTAPNVSDGQTFSLTNATGTVTFELDSDATLNNPSNVRVTLPASPITFTNLGNAMVAAINGSSLNIVTQFNGNSRGPGVVLLPMGTTLNAGTTNFATSETASEYFDEIRAISATTSPPPDPGAVKAFFSVRFRAKAPGALTFSPNAPESLFSENGLYSQQFEPNAPPTPLPNNLIDFGSPISIQIISDPSGPVAVGDTLTTNEDTNLTIVASTLLANDSSGATPPRVLSVASIQTIPGVTQGTLVGNVYTPPRDVNGNAADFLTYTVSDTAGLTATATITINITPVNDPPVAADDAFSAVVGSIDNDLDVLANDTPGPANESSQTLTIVAVGTTSAGGTVTIAPNGRSVLYTPNPAFVGQETFTYTVRDNGNPAEQDTATVTVDVQPATRPFAVRDRVNAVEDSTNNQFDVLANDLVNDGTTAVLINVSNPPNGTASVSNGFVLYTPDPDFFGTDIFTYEMNESGGIGPNSIGTVTVTVANVNDRPVLVNDTVQAAENEVRTIPFTELTANDSRGPGEDAQTLTIIPASVIAISSVGGQVAVSGSNIVFTPTPGFSGQFLFSYNAIDNGTPPLDAASPATVTINITPFNDPPVLQNDTVAGTEDVPVTIALTTLLSNDSPGPGEDTGPDRQTLTVTGVTAITPNAGTVAIVGNNVIYTPVKDFNGPFLFTYTAIDDGFPPKSGTATVTVNMAAVNDPPVVGADTVRAFKNNPARIPFATLLANDTAGAANEADQILTIVSVQGAVNGTVMLDITRSEVVFTPATDYTGPASFQYTVRDNGGGNDTASGTVTVNVEEFQPSSIGGTVWVDETHDNIIGQMINGNVVRNERYMGGIKVRLTGTSLGQTISPQTAVTMADGTYKFEDLGPGSYQITFDAPVYLGVASSHYTTNVYNVDIAEPGGFDLIRNYAVAGIDAAKITRLGRLMDQLVSRYHVDGTISLRGAYFAVARDNGLMWGLKLDGFEDAIYTEAVFSGADLLVTVVDANRRIRTARVSNEFFSFITDSNGDRLVRLIGSMANFNWVDTSLTNPAFNAQNYLASVDALFDQRGW